MAYYVLKRLTPSQLTELQQKVKDGTATELEKTFYHHCYNLDDTEPLVQALKGYSH